MKKFVSVALAVIFCLTLAFTAMIPASAASDNPTNALLADPTTAADGTLLYKVQFGYTHGVYQSHEIARDAANSGTITIHENELGVTFTLPEDYDHSAAPAKKFWYGDKIEGLVLAEGNRYTIKYKIRSEETDIRGTGNCGFFFNTDALGSTYATSYGSYGNFNDPDGPFYDLFRSGSHVAGEFIAGSYVKFNDTPARENPVLDADGYVDCQVEVDGFKYYLYINGNFFDCTTIAADDQVAAGNLGIIFYTYSSCASIKDVEVYKGLSITTPAADTTTEDNGGTTKDPYAEDDEPTDAADTTTEEPAAETTPDAGTTEAPKADTATAADEEEVGCGGVAVFAQVVALLGCAVSFVVIRKKN